jgi:hypothetical protein
LEWWGSATAIAANPRKVIAMALPNIFREPRREITESVVGLAVFGVFGWGDYHFAQWFQEVGGPPWPIGIILGVAGAFIAFPILHFTHELGDAICNALEDRGIHLRPRWRR